MLSTSKNDEVSQNCFVIDVVKFKIEDVSQNCFVFDVVKLKIEDVSQNCFVFDLVNFEKRISLAELLRF